MSDTISKFIARDILTDQLEKSVQDLNNKEKFLCSSFHAS